MRQLGGASLSPPCHCVVGRRRVAGPGARVAALPTGLNRRRICEPCCKAGRWGCRLSLTAMVLGGNPGTLVAFDVAIPLRRNLYPTSLLAAKAPGRNRPSVRRDGLVYLSHSEFETKTQAPNYYRGHQLVVDTVTNRCDDTNIPLCPQYTTVTTTKRSPDHDRPI